MDPVAVVIVLKRIQLPLQIEGIPEQDMIEILAPDGSDQPFDKRMRNGHVGYRFNLLDTQNAQVGPPSVERKQRIVIGAEIPWNTYVRHGSIKHSTERRPIDVPALNRQPDDAPAELIHDHQHPVTFQPY